MQTSTGISGKETVFNFPDLGDEKFCSQMNICTLFHVVFSWATAKGLYLQSCTRMEKSLGQTSRSNRQL